LPEKSTTWTSTSVSLRREELVAQAVALVCAGDQSGHVDEFRRDEPRAVRTVADVGDALLVELRCGTVDAA